MSSLAIVSDSADVDFFGRMAGLAGGPLLDLGCGYGRVALRLLESGQPVTAVDADAERLETLAVLAQALPEDRRRLLRVYQADFLRLALDETFSMVFLVGNSFVLLEDDAHMRAALATIRRHLDQRGVAWVDVALADCIPDSTDYTLLGQSPADPDTYHFVRAEVDRPRGSACFEHLFVRVSAAGIPSIRSSRCQTRLLDPPRFLEMVHSVGLTVVSETPHFAGTPHTLYGLGHAGESTN